ncbi:MAG: YqiA/YcfP family alpha/beta fold hydrolase [Cyanobacteria bacterium P01_C01_bin.89]
MRYIYLHGFASSPKSKKVQYLRNCIADRNITLEAPDLNQGGFENLTLTRQLEQVTELVGGDRAVLIGSSFGGLTAAYLGDRLKDQIAHLILLAPAFGFPQRWRDNLSPEKQKHWESTGEILVYHHGEEQECSLNYSFWEDAQRYDWTQISNTVSTQIFHGIHDDTVPVKYSRQYTEGRHWVELVELDSDHRLSDPPSLTKIATALLNTIP